MPRRELWFAYHDRLRHVVACGGKPGIEFAVDVTKEDIVSHERDGNGQGGMNAVVKALCRHVPEHLVFLPDDVVEEDRAKVPPEAAKMTVALPERVRRFVRRFARGGGAEPFTFLMRIPYHRRMDDFVDWTHVQDRMRRKQEMEASEHIGEITFAETMYSVTRTQDQCPMMVAGVQVVRGGLHSIAICVTVDQTLDDIVAKHMGAVRKDEIPVEFGAIMADGLASHALMGRVVDVRSSGLEQTEVFVHCHNTDHYMLNSLLKGDKLTVRKVDNLEKARIVNEKGVLACFDLKNGFQRTWRNHIAWSTPATAKLISVTRPLADMARDGFKDET